VRKLALGVVALALIVVGFIALAAVTSRPDDSSAALSEAAQPQPARALPALAADLL
jgi:hypothetical protein